MAEGIVCIIFVIGLLNFAKDAPQLLKDLLGKAGLFAGLDLNPKGQFKRNLSTAKDTVHKAGSAIGNGIKKAYNAPGNIKKGVMGKIGGGIGGARGAITGFKSGQGLANKVGGFFSGGSAGMTAGNMAGQLGQLKNAGSWGSKSGEEAARYTAEMKNNFKDSKTKYGTMMDQFNNVNKTKVDRLKNDKDALKAQYDSNINEYVRNNMGSLVGTAKGSSDVKMHKLHDLIEEEAKKSNRSVDSVKRDTMKMAALRHEALNQTNAMSAMESAQYLATKRAEEQFKPGYETARNKLEFQIAQAKADGIKGQEAAMQMTMANLQASMDDWGPDLAKDMQDKFTNALQRVSNPDVVAALNSAGAMLGKGNIAGPDSTGEIELKDIADIANKLQASGNIVALSQIMNTINETAGKIDLSNTIMQTANQTFNPQPTNNNNNNGSGSGH